MNKTILFYPKLEPHKDYHYMPISLLAGATNMAAKKENIVVIDQRVDKGCYIRLAKELHKANFFICSVYTGYQLTQAYKISRWVKKRFPHVQVIWAGPHVTILPEQTLDSGVVDAVIQGDTDTGENPIPFWLIDIEKYINPETKRFIYVSSYGCVGNCTFCSTVPKRKIKFLPLERVEKDIDYLMSQYDWKEAVFFDATIFTKPDRALFISKLMKKHNLQWICDSRADEICRTPKDMLDEIVNSGLKQITIGLESGSQRVVDNMKKGTNHLENYKKCAKIMSQYNIKMCSGVIFGTPCETPEDIKQTIEYIKEIKAINPNFYISTTFFMPLPCTGMADMAKLYGYKEPCSLAEWAEHGANSHYRYNEYNSSMWIKDPEEYKQIYDEFVAGNSDLFI